MIPPENIIVQHLLSIWNHTSSTNTNSSSSYVHYLPIFTHLAPFYTMKYGQCGGASRIEQIDCLHVCAFSPPMWISIWKELLLQLQEVGFVSQQHRITTQTTTTNTSLPPPITVDQHGFPLIVEDIQLIALNTTNTNINTNSTVKEDLYVLYHGLKRPISLHDIPYYIKSSEMMSNIHIMNEEEWNIIPTVELLKRPILLPDHTIIKQSSEQVKELYLMEQGYKRLIPDWDTFVYLKLDIHTVKHISKEIFDSIEMGVPIPTKDQQLLQQATFT